MSKPKHKLLTQNKKMSKSSTDNRIVFNFSIPALFGELNGEKFTTCPKAKQCASGCYARQGAYIWSNVRKRHNANLAATMQDSFQDNMIAEIELIERNAKRRSKQVYVRVHDAGDFYSKQYAQKWMDIAKAMPSVQFYAYTKSLNLFRGPSGVKMPKNFTVIFSQGGKLDATIDTASERHSRVFETEESLLKAGYINASTDDLLALTDNIKVGLIYHGTKSYAKTTWNKVS